MRFHCPTALAALRIFAPYGEHRKWLVTMLWSNDDCCFSSSTLCISPLPQWGILHKHALLQLPLLLQGGIRRTRLFTMYDKWRLFIIWWNLRCFCFEVLNLCGHIYIFMQRMFFVVAGKYGICKPIVCMKNVFDMHFSTVWNAVYLQYLSFWFVQDIVMMLP